MAPRQLNRIAPDLEGARYRIQVPGKKNDPAELRCSSQVPVPGSALPPGWEMIARTGKLSLAGGRGEQVANPGFSCPGRGRSLSNTRTLPRAPDETPSSGMSAETQPFLFRVTSIVGQKADVNKCTTSVGPAAETEACGRTHGETGTRIRHEPISPRNRCHSCMNMNSPCKRSSRPEWGPLSGTCSEYGEAVRDSGI